MTKVEFSEIKKDLFKKAKIYEKITGITPKTLLKNY